MLYNVNYKFVISTSRKPTQITRRFAQFLKHYFNAVYINRGKSSFSKIVNQAKSYENSLLLVITETKGNPSSVNVYDLGVDAENPCCSIYINVSLPQENSSVNTDSSAIVLINKARGLDDLFVDMSSFKSGEKIRSNCIVIRDYEDNMYSADFIDKKGLDTDYRVYIKGFKLY